MAITLLPTPPSRQDPANFNVRADEFLGALPTFGTEANSLATDVNSKQVTASNAATTATNAASTATNKATEATNAATTATTKATEASNSATSAANAASTATNKASEAVTSATNAANSANTATTKATEASNSANQALLYATAQNKASSTTNVTPALGSKYFTIETNKAFVAGQYISIASNSNIANKMAGYITSYNVSTGALVVQVDLAEGSAATDWVIGIASPSSINLDTLNRGAHLRETDGAALISNKRYGIWTGGGAITMSLPSLANTKNGDEIVLGNLHSTWGSNPFTINCPTGVSFRTKTGATDTTLVCNTNAVQGITLYCVWNDGSSVQWAILF